MTGPNAAVLSGQVRLATRRTVEIQTPAGLLRIDRNRLPDADVADTVTLRLELDRD